MNKTKMILAVIGGAIGIVVLALGFLVWRSTVAKTAALEGDDEEGTEGLESVVSTAESLSRSPIYPCVESETAIESNRTALADWSEEAKRHLARGDRFFTPVTPAAFKSFIGSDAKRLKALPGAVQGRLAKPEFAFGPFKDYIDEGKMPADSELAGLQRKWDDVATVTELLATNGIAELLDVQFKGAEASAAATAQDRSGKKKARKPAAAVKKDAAPTALPAPCTYVFTFAAKPASLIRVINALEVGERFTVVESLAFERAKDIADVLNADEKDEAKKTSGRGRRRGRNRVEEEKEESEDEKSKNRLVTDPQMDGPLTVTLTVAVYDFRTLEEEEEKGASK